MRDWAPKAAYLAISSTQYRSPPEPSGRSVYVGGIFQSDCCHHIAPMVRREKNVQRWGNVRCVGSRRYATAAMAALATSSAQKMPVVHFASKRNFNTSQNGLVRTKRLLRLRGTAALPRESSLATSPRRYKCRRSFAARDDDGLGRKAHPAAWKVGLGGPFQVRPRGAQLLGGQPWHDGPEHLGHLESERPEVRQPYRRFEAEGDYALIDRGSPCPREQSGQLARLCVAKRTGVIRRRGGQLQVACDHLQSDAKERVDLASVPHRNCEAPTRFEHPKHLTKRGKWIVEEHDAEPADDRVEAAGPKRQRVRRASRERDVAQAPPARFELRRGDHVGHRVRARDRGGRAADLGDAQRRLAGPRRHVQRGFSRPDGGALDESVRERLEHRPDHRRVLSPVGRGFAPCPQNGAPLFLRRAHGRDDT